MRSKECLPDRNTVSIRSGQMDIEFVDTNYYPDDSEVKFSDDGILVMSEADLSILQSARKLLQRRKQPFSS